MNKQNHNLVGSQNRAQQLFTLIKRPRIEFKWKSFHFKSKLPQQRHSNNNNNQSKEEIKIIDRLIIRIKHTIIWQLRQCRVYGVWSRSLVTKGYFQCALQNNRLYFSNQSTVSARLRSTQMNCRHRSMHRYEFQFTIISNTISKWFDAVAADCNL